MNSEHSEHQVLPVLPLKEMVFFPNSIAPLFVMRPASLAALEAALDDKKRLFLATQKNENTANPGPKDLYDVGCVVEILQVLRLPDNSAKVLVEGQSVGRIADYFAGEPYLKAYVVEIGYEARDDKRIEALRRMVARQFETYASLSDSIPEDLLHSVKNVSDTLALANSIANYASLPVERKQEILGAATIDKKLILLSQALSQENELLQIESNIASQVKSQISQTQKEYFLSEQLKVIERELGLRGKEEDELAELAGRLKRAKLSREAREKASREIARLSRMAPMAPEAAVSRAYVEWLLDLPWGKRTKDQLEIDRARRILDEDHHGLEKVKERILEFIAVLRTANELKGPILCLVGPPGVGKTSLGRSIARALGRKFVRVSLGGVRDEAEIRGHRRTYIGSLPGRIIQCLKKAGSENPVFLLDEIDKLGLDYRGDPASALLEVLDPEQNKAFNDHYLEVDYDLSRVLFIATANSAAGAPPALLDRMEIIQLSGYTSQEKRKIAEAFLIPKQIKAHGLRRAAIAIPDETVSMLIEGYTREAGVRQLEREIAALCRKAARERAETGAAGKMTLGPDKARALLGRPRFSPLRHESEPEVGVATGLAWTETGGELLPVETTTMPGEGKLELTGQLGSVMQESAKAALSYIRSRAARFGLDPQFHKTLDLHVHIPEGAIPKDGPSAGVALLVSMASALTGRPARRDIAMTGEITLRGKALKIGGFKEKALAAHRSKIARVIAPEDNRADLEDLPQEALREIDFAFIENVETALDLLLEPEKKPE